MKKLILITMFTTVVLMTSCSKEKVYTCTCTFTMNNPGQWTNQSPNTQTMYHGPSKDEAQKAYNANHGNNGTSTGNCIITEE